MTLLKPISLKQFSATISDISDVYWMVVTGGQVSREKIAYNDGSKGLAKQLVGFTSVDDLTLTKSFDPEADAKVLQWCRDQIENPTVFNIALQPLKADLTGSTFPGSSQVLYSDCTLFAYKMPSMDRNSSGLAVLEVSVICNSLPTYQ